MLCQSQDISRSGVFGGLTRFCPIIGYGIPKPPWAALTSARWRKARKRKDLVDPPQNPLELLALMFASNPARNVVVAALPTTLIYGIGGVPCIFYPLVYGIRSVPSIFYSSGIIQLMLCDRSQDEVSSHKGYMLLSNIMLLLCPGKVICVSIATL